ncbi:adenylate cyclase associated N terminal-domain-containing protein [Hyaloraphidium curvatum]|nr:adenylate cyclase associated N terminal-domain-containing protein [Hyaloraphidium curvatum]
MEAALVTRLEAVAAKLEALAASGASPAAPAPAAAAAAPAAASSAASKAWDDVSTGALAEFAGLSEKLGGLVQEQAAAVKNAFAAVGSLVVTASQSKKPAATALPEFLKPLGEAIGKIVELKDKNRPSPQFNHLSAVAEGIPALGWVQIEPAPAPFVEEMKASAEFYTNRVIKDNKEKDPVSVDWAKSWIKLLSEVQSYVKQHHTTGLAWNPKGGDAKPGAAAPAPEPAAAPAAAAAPPPPPAGGPPPPPPPPPADYLDKYGGPPAPAAEGGAQALFSELNKGAAVTAGLKHVDKSQMTHKNPALRAGGTVPDLEKEKAKKAPAAAPAAAASAPAKPPRKELDGNKWSVENFVGDKEIVVEGVEAKQIVYIYNLQDCTVQVKGKVNAVAIDNCRKTGILLESVVSSVEVVNSKSLQVQVTGKAPTVSVDKTDGFHLFLSAEGLDTELLSSKSSEVNVSFPKGEDWEEKAVPEQFITKIKDGKVVTEIVQHKG